MARKASTTPRAYVLFITCLFIGCEFESFADIEANDEAGDAQTRSCEAATNLDGVCTDEWVGVRQGLSGSTRISISTQLAAIRDVQLGDQVRIERNGGDDHALFTVAEVRANNDPADPWMIGMSEKARLRLGAGACEPGFCAHLITNIAPFPPEFDEASVLGIDRVLVLAPHGGDIEQHTDDQADLLASELAAYEPTVWVCEGYVDGGGAYSTWHIPSTEISTNSFPLLAEVDQQSYEWVVSFHGFSGKPSSDCIPSMPVGADPMKTVIVGGRAAHGLRVEIAAAIEATLDAQPGNVGYRAVAPLAGPCSGQEPNNIVNRFTSGGGIQIESGPEARNHGNAQVVASVLADVLAQQLGAP